MSFGSRTPMGLTAAASSLVVVFFATTASLVGGSSTVGSPGSFWRCRRFRFNRFLQGK
jgi:hypothetical protein